jgi:hypothetical protein
MANGSVKWLRVREWVGVSGGEFLRNAETCETQKRAKRQLDDRECATHLAHSLASDKSASKKTRGE